MGKEPKAALRISLTASLETFTALDEEGRPLAMFGVSAGCLMTGIGVPWFLGRDEVFLYGYDLMKRGPGIIAAWLTLFTTLENIISSENRKAQRLLEKWGAVVGGEPVVHRGLEFVPFSFTRPVIQSPPPSP